MKLYYSGHSYAFACEQSMLVLFPAERPEYSETQEKDNAAYISLRFGKTCATAVTILYREGGRFQGRARVALADLRDEVLRDRLLPRILRLSFYRAAKQCTGKAMPWGALTGVRPGKLAIRYLEAGETEAQTARSMERDYSVTPERAQMCAKTASFSLAAKGSLAPEDVCLYVGIPFCPTRCAYCSFVSSSVSQGRQLIPAYLEALKREIAATARACRETGLRPVSLYMGGGTPTTLSAEEMGALMDTLAAEFDLSHLREYTVEAGRPDTVTPEKLAVLLEKGCTRISVNPQSMSDAVLEAIGRRHTAEETRRAYRQAREAGFTNINMDLIAGLPADTPETFRRTLEEVLALAPENITVHTLCLKKGTRITLEGTPIPDEAAVAQMLDDAGTLLRAGGFSPYYLYRQKFISGGFENTGWCRPGTENLYNICIMEELCTVLAMGGGGSTKLVNPSTGYIQRLTDKKYPKEFIASIEEACLARQEIGKFYDRERLLVPEKGSQP